MANPLTNSEPSDSGDVRAEAKSIGDDSETDKPRSYKAVDTATFLGWIVGIGASAGGLEAFSELLKNLPTNTGMAFVVVQHLDPRHTSILAELLGSLTRLRVIQVHGEMPVEPDHVYVIPPNAIMVIENRILKLNPPAQDPSRQRRPIDVFLTSLADDAHNCAIGVVLSGALSDGTLGLKAIKAEGGITFAQDGTAKFEDMPRSAISAGVVDFILSPRRIAQELVAIAQHPLRAQPVENLLEDRPTLDRILRYLRKRSGVDFATIQRRLARRMLVHKVETLEQYFELLQREPTEVEALFDDLLIKVTEFFRDAAVFDVLKKVAFPAMVKDRAQGDGCEFGFQVARPARRFIRLLLPCWNIWKTSAFPCRSSCSVPMSASE
jgi:two-component system, chemotaxis family, CheB/CheR fusion protein